MPRRRKAAPHGINTVVFALICFVVMFLGMNLGMHRSTAPTATLRGGGESSSTPAEARAAQEREREAMRRSVARMQRGLPAEPGSVSEQLAASASASASVTDALQSLKAAVRGSERALRVRVLFCSRARLGARARARRCAT